MPSPFQVTFNTGWITHEEVTICAQRSIRYEPNNDVSLYVSKLMFWDNGWTVRGVGVMFEAAPALKYAEVLLHSPGGSTTGCSSEALLSNLAGMKSLHVWLNFEAFCHLSWTFLYRESARELRLIEVRGIPSTLSEIEDLSVEELVHCAAALPRLLGGEPLELDFTDNYFSGEFDRRIIELLKNSGREVAFRTNISRGGRELILDESAYSVDVDGTTTRYASKKSGIVVEVNGRRSNHPDNGRSPSDKATPRNE
ncbi:hypothetical protein AAVH_29266 [Aphelenchoides avenae]|nr:hypothetical protein AAVH_29266 [Aphelenchus avenae]